MDSLIPPPWWMDGLNTARAEEGLPPLRPLDGLAMLSWYFANMPVPPGNLVTTTTC